jgi:hypothetical protein
MLDMFTTPGWKYFIEEFEDMAKSGDTLHGVNDLESLFRKKGKLEVLNVLAAYEDYTRQLLDEEDATQAFDEEDI